jgi:endonuclease YncB( thermonuclease family)
MNPASLASVSAASSASRFTRKDINFPGVQACVIGGVTSANVDRCAIRALLLSASLFLVGADAHADRIGRVSRVHDGDSLTFVTTEVQLRVRLVDIDAPELAQPFGKQSREALATLCTDRPARIVEQGKDRYGRILARVTCAGVDAGAEQVRRGHAWVFVRFAPKGSPLYKVQAEARQRRVGLWADPKPLEPWEWRRAKNKGEVLTRQKL